ncbi:MAG: Wzz/FepE/Etk N-terminal domain-containing protein [Gammaproteobacteria bacterium]|nr:Wzz/FepE/Etk N-terminal domain-containing protein [Gammaproteobacteria bacterium]
MNSNNLKEIKPIYIQEAIPYADDEISLIDLAMVLILRKKMIGIILTLFIALGITAALLIPKKYTYSTSIEIGSQIINGTINSFESPQTLLAKLQHSFIPRTLNEHQQLNPEDDKKYKINASIPKSSEIIVLEIKATEDQADSVIKLLQNITQKATQDHSRIFESVKRNLQSRLQQANTKLAKLGSGTDNQGEKTSLQDNIENYSAQLANLRNTREILPPMKSIEPTGTSRILIVIIAIFSGLFIAIFTAFFAEFATKVREKSSESSIS